MQHLLEASFLRFVRLFCTAARVFCTAYVFCITWRLKHRSAFTHRKHAPARAHALLIIASKQLRYIMMYEGVEY